MAGRLLFIILMCSFHKIQVQGQRPELSGHHTEDDYIFTCSLPASVEHDTTCNLYFGEESRPVVTAKTWKTRSSKTNQLFCLFTVQTNDLWRHLCSVQQKDVSCDYRLEYEANTTLSLAPRSDRYNLRDFFQNESNERRRVTTMTTGSSAVNMSRDTTPTTTRQPDNKISDDDLNSTASTTVTKVTSGNKCYTLNMTGNSSVPKDTMDNMNHATDNKTTVAPSGQTENTDSSSVSVTSEKPTTVITPDILTSTNTTTMNPAPGDVQTVTASLSSTTFPKTETQTWKLIIVVACFGTAVTVILVVLVILGTNRSGTSSHTRSQANIKPDYICMNTICDGRQLPAGIDETYSEITSVRDAGVTAGSDKLQREKSQNEHSDIYHVYATISEEPAPSAQQDGVYSLLQPH
ncbi:uncharacterized protein LOC125006374 isoform X2 [Mugil cephalus]|uniref:uncharacterized protein LOC125006374 isoform X2 n=1 Tax=Mugil cephalus TaxID=48193 RepID=UPI001FB78BBA|nr:uncharacterized protein LOC125006374 isoform X2 [Mugil cephalus]